MKLKKNLEELAHIQSAYGYITGEGKETGILDSVHFCDDGTAVIALKPGLLTPRKTADLVLAAGMVAGLECLVLTDDWDLREGLDFIRQAEGFGFGLAYEKVDGPEQLEGYDALVLPKRLKPETDGLSMGLGLLPRVVIETGSVFKESGKKMRPVKRDDAPLTKMMRLYREVIRKDLVSRQEMEDSLKKLESGEMTGLEHFGYQDRVLKEGISLEEGRNLIAEVMDNVEETVFVENPELALMTGFFRMVFFCPHPEDLETLAEKQRAFSDELQGLKREMRQSRITFVIQKGSFSEKLQKAVEEAKDRKEVEKLAERLEASPGAGDLVEMEEGEFREALTKRLIDLVMEEPDEYPEFARFSGLYSLFLKEAYKNRELLRREDGKNLPDD